MSHLLILRVAIGVDRRRSGRCWRPEALVEPLGTIAAWTAAYLAIAVVGEWARQRTTRFNYWILTGLLLVDGVYLAAAMYATGGTQSPIRFVVYLHLVAVSLLASYRTGLKIALWHSLLLFVAALRAGRPPRDRHRGHAGRRHRVRPDAGPQRHLVLAVRHRDLDLLRAQRARAAPAPGRPPGARRRRRQARHRRGRDPPGRASSSRSSSNGSASSAACCSASPTAGSSCSRPTGRPRRRRPRASPTGSSPAPGSAARSCRSSASTRRATRSSRTLLPDARNVLVAPMIADGRTIGAIVVEHRARRRPGVERRVAAMVGQFAAIAALNLRNAVLLQHVQDLAERDSLTGAANRRMFQLALERVLRRQAGRAPGGQGHRGPVPRPRRLQGRQRHARPRRRRRAARRGDRADLGPRPRGRPRGPPRRRRVRGPHRG